MADVRKAQREVIYSQKNKLTSLLSWVAGTKDKVAAVRIMLVVIGTFLTITPPMVSHQSYCGGSMHYPKPIAAVFAPLLERAIPALGFTAVDVKTDPEYPYYAASFRNEQVEMKCELERGRPAIDLKRHDGEHWFQLSRALRALNGKVQDPLDVEVLTQSFLGEYPKLIAALDTEPFNELYLEQFSSLGSYRPW